MVKDETESPDQVKKFSNRTYRRFTDSLLIHPSIDDEVQTEFIEKYLNIYYDLQFYFLQNAG